MTDDAAIGGDHWRRTWLVLLLDGAARAGLTPIDQMLLHQAAYLANALAPVYRLPIEHGMVTRWKRGPFFPDLQWDLDRLAIMGLATLQSVATAEDDRGWWFETRYSTGPLAAEFLTEVGRFEQARRVARFHRELMAALAALPQGDLRWAAIADANYANIVDGDLEAAEVVIDFADFQQRNFSIRTVARIDGSLPSSIVLQDRDRIHLYLGYLARRSKVERA